MIDSAPEQVAVYINSLSDFVKFTEVDGNYGHIGATLADAVLQSNNNYERNVRSRIARIRTLYSDAPKLWDLRRLLLRITVREFLNWNGTRKPGTFSTWLACWNVRWWTLRPTYDSGFRL